MGIRMLNEQEAFMNSINIKKIEIIVSDLLSELEKESGKLQIEYDDNVARILEIEEHIHNYKENEDVNMQVFSPRKIENHNEERINAITKEKENIEAANKSLYRQIKYYTDKKEKLKEILNLIEEDRTFDIDTGVIKSETKEDEINTAEDITIETDISDNEIFKNLRNISSRLFRESKSIDEDYYRTKEEIKAAIKDINSVLEKIQ